MRIPSAGSGDGEGVRDMFLKMKEMGYDRMELGVLVHIAAFCEVQMAIGVTQPGNEDPDSQCALATLKQTANQIYDALNRREAEYLRGRG